MSSDSVQIAGGNSHSFTQNGQVDWVAFGKSIWSTSSAVLQRFASAGVQPITFGAGLALASAFDLDRVGKQRMDSALRNLQGVWSFEKLIWFGFGTRSFLHVMADAQSGINCIVLCSALGEVYNEHAAAWILDELWKVYGYPQQFLPSHSQLTALVKACSGVLTRTEFSLIPDRMLGHILELDGVFPHSMANSEDIAKAMSGLFKISKGDIKKITVMGGTECAFIAAFAHWVLNLKVYVDDEAGKVIYQDVEAEDAQVEVTYCRQHSLSLVQISSTTYILREVEDIFIRAQTYDQTFLTIRTPWDGCLTRVFGRTFNVLTKAPTTLGGFFGSVARVYRALALGENDVGKFSRTLYINFVESSYGIGFINSVASIFPELKRVNSLFDEMQMALDVPLQEALRTTERTILDLEQLCQCKGCTPRDTGRDIKCIVALALSIREMVSTISCVTGSSDILPTIRGINHVYSRNKQDLLGSKILQSRPLLAIALGLVMENERGSELEHLRRFDLLSYPMEIFSGHSYHSRYLTENNPQGGREFCTATVKQGLCYYLNCLRSLSSHAENARMVHIVPGHIQMGDKQYSSVYDVPNQTTAHLSPSEFDIMNEYKTSRIIQQPTQLEIKIELLGLEKFTDHELVVFFRAVVPGEPPIQLKPGRINDTVLRGTGILTCEKSHCTSRLVLPCALIERGWHIPDKNDKDSLVGSRTGHICFLWPQLEDLARCVAIQEQWNSGADEIFLRRGECFSCGTISLVRERPEGRKELFHIL